MSKKAKAEVVLRCLKRLDVDGYNNVYNPVPRFHSIVSSS